MKISVIDKRTRIPGYALLFLQTILLLVTLYFYMGEKYVDQWQDYLSDQTTYTVHLNNLPAGKKQEALGYLEDQASRKNFLLLRKERDTGMLIGVAGDSSKLQADFSYYNVKLLSKADLNRLLTSQNSAATIGLATGSINQIKSLYQFAGSGRVVIAKMDYLVKQTKEVDGSYQLAGLSSERDYQTIIKGLSRITGQKASNFTSQMGGHDSSDGLTYVFTAGFLLLTSVGLLSYFFVILFSLLKTAGDLILLGWSKQDILLSALRPFLSFTAAAGGLSAVVLAGWAGQGTGLTLSFALVFLGGLVLSLVMTCLVFALASFLLLSLSNIDLIKGRYPRRPLYAVTIAFYLIFSSGLVGVLSGIDGPLDSVAANQEQARQWQKNAGMQLLESTSSGQDGDRAYTDSSSAIYRDFYHYYQYLQDKPGVYLANSFYASKSWLADSRANESYKSLPLKPVTILTASPSYLRHISFKVSQAALKAAKAGSRVYFIPQSMTSRERRALEAFLKEDAQTGVSSGDLQTAFVKKRKFLFVTYQEQGEVFTWNNNVKEPYQSRNPVIYLAVPENMTYVEIGGLFASGMNGYLKFADQKTRERYTSQALLARFNLSDNKPSFVSVSSYIDGLQKSLWQTVIMFGAALAILLVLLLLLLLILVMIYKQLNREEIAVKKFLGFSPRQLHALPLGVILLTGAGQIFAAGLLRSKVGLFLLPLICLLQLSLFYLYVIKDSFNDVVELFKGE